MTQKKPSTTTVDDWLLAVWQAYHQDGNGLGRFGLQISMTPTARKGVWAVELRALHVLDGRPISVHARIRREFPTSDLTTFGGVLYQMSIDLSNECERELLPTYPEPTTTPPSQ